LRTVLALLAHGRLAIDGDRVPRQEEKRVGRLHRDLRFLADGREQEEAVALGFVGVALRRGARAGVERAPLGERMAPKSPFLDCSSPRFSTYCASVASAKACSAAMASRAVDDLAIVPPLPSVNYASAARAGRSPLFVRRAA
jgi:hypothetical protein